MSQKALLTAPRDPTPPAAEAIISVSRQYGVSPLRQLREMTALRFGPGKLAFHEYFATGAYDPNISMADKRAFVGRTGSYEINVAASPMKLTGARAFLRDKVMYTALLKQLGLPTTETQAVVHAHRGFGDLPTLRRPEDVVAFLTHDARYPVFAKPCEGAASVGSALIVAREDEMLRLGNGRTVEMNSFAQEIFADYPEGFILQDAIQQHRAVEALIGRSVGTLRVVTLRDAEGITPLYTVWKVPSPRAMSDNFWQSGSMVALLDDATGAVTACNVGVGMAAEWINMHPVSRREFKGFHIPHWRKLMQTACAGHALFPEFGIVGWDIAMAPDGPIIIECNDNPFHVLWQLCAAQGIRNPVFAPRFEAAAAQSQAILQGRASTFRKRQRERRGEG